MDKSFLEGIDPESIEDVEWKFQRVMEDEELSKLLREIEEAGVEAEKDEKEFQDWKNKIEKAYEEAPSSLKEWVMKVVNDKVEELGKLYDELSSIDYTEKHDYIRSITLSALDHPEYPEGEDPKDFLEAERGYIESAIEKWLLQRSLQIRKYLRSAEAKHKNASESESK